MALPQPGAPFPPDNDRGPDILACIWTLTSVAICTVSARIYTRTLLKRVAGWDDTTVVAALMLVIGYSAGMSWQVHNGFGRHEVYLTMHNLVEIAKLNIVVNILNTWTLFFVRLSVAIFLRRMLKSVNGKWKLVHLWVAMALNIAVAIATTILFAVICIPLSEFWDKSIHGFCVDLVTFSIVQRVLGSINCLVDFILVLAPFLIIRKLQLSGKVKLGSYLLLTCGIITAGCSIGRTVTVDVYAQDPTWSLNTNAIFAVAEMDFAIIFASLPALRQCLVYVQETRSLLPSSQGVSDSFSRLKSKASFSVMKFKSPGRAMHRQDSDMSLVTGKEAIQRSCDVSVELSDQPSGTRAPSYDIGEDFCGRKPDKSSV